MSAASHTQAGKRFQVYAGVYVCLALVRKCEYPCASQGCESHNHLHNCSQPILTGSRQVVRVTPVVIFWSSLGSPTGHSFVTHWSCPNTLNVHHALGAENTPIPSYTTT